MKFGKEPTFTIERLSTKINGKDSCSFVFPLTTTSNRRFFLDKKWEGIND